jgi:hypothetical protein
MPVGNVNKQGFGEQVGIGGHGGSPVWIKRLGSGRL